jgi:hypothetical protein
LQAPRNWQKCSALDCVHFSKIFFSKKIIFSRNSREIREKKIEIEISFCFTFGILITKMTTKLYTKNFTFGILITKMTTKLYTKLASIEINDEILSKVGGIRKNLRKNF